MMPQTLFRAAAVALAVLVLAACGQRGPLTLPDAAASAPPATSSAVPASAASAPAPAGTAY